MKDFRSNRDRQVCAGCTNKFGESPDCRKCERDAEARAAQHSWWHAAPHLLFMGVNVGQCLSHAARGYILGHLRQENPVE